MKTRIPLSIVAALSCAAALAEDIDAGFEAKRRQMLDKIGPFIYNTDGCEMYYYPGNKAIAKEEFRSLRLDYAKRTKVGTVSYCPISSGFGFFVVPDVGEYNTRSEECSEDIHGVYPKGAKDVRHYNAAKAFETELGTDAVQMSIDWCRENNRQAFVSVRFNDTHDSHPDYGHYLFPPFKAEHPECLMGAKERPPKVCAWTAVNFAEPLVRERMLAFIRQFFEKYDLDGLEIDFFRHVQLFKSVAQGGVASEAELRLMTELMSSVRQLAESYGRKRGRPILMAVRTPDSVGYCRAVGIDLNAWFSRKLVDIWTSTGYFQLEQWPTTVAFARKHGVRCYASIDESRIPTAARAGKLPIIYGRESLACYRARYAAAMSAGCDGMSLFNLEYARLKNYAQDDPHDLVGSRKLYFATERGSGGYSPGTWLVDGERFNRMPKIDPGRPPALKPGVPFAFEILIGEDFAVAKVRGLKPSVKVLALSEKDNPVEVTLNGHRLTTMSASDGVPSFSAEPTWLRKGRNAFAVVSATRNVLHDFAVEVTYSQVPEKEAK